MYLRWRGTTIAAIRADPAVHRNPTSIGGTTQPGDGRVAGPDVAGDLDAAAVQNVGSEAPADGDEAPAATDGRNAGLTRAAAGDDASEPTSALEDPWAAEQFLDTIEGPVYGTTPENLRNGLDLVAERDEVWISPGLPFIVPLFVGLVVALTYGDLLFGVLRALGAV
jgi:preflagellin peptidase FlaK